MFWWIFVSQLIISTPKNFIANELNIFFYMYKFFCQNPKTHILVCQLGSISVFQDEFLWPAKFFHRKVLVLKNIFNIYHMVISSLDQKIFTIMWNFLPCSSVMFGCIMYEFWLLKKMYLLGKKNLRASPMFLTCVCW